MSRTLATSLFAALLLPAAATTPLSAQALQGRLVDDGCGARSDGRFLGQGYHSGENELLHTDFVVVADRAYVFGLGHLYAFRCPS